MLVKRLTLTLTDAAAAILQGQVAYRERGAYVSQLIEAAAGGNTPPPPTPPPPATNAAAIRVQLADLMARVAELEERLDQLTQ